MKHLERVVWGEGMLMCPQHLQQQDLYNESTLAARLAAITHEQWGVQHLGIDESALKSGTMKINEFTGVLSGGLALEFTSQDVVVPATRPIDEHFPTTAPLCEVFLAVARAREGIANYSDSSNGANPARYLLTSRAVPDLTNARTEQSVGFGRPNVQIMFGDEDRDDFETSKIAEVVRDRTGSFELSKAYIPPALHLNGSETLQGFVRDVLGLMLVKQRELTKTRRQIDEARVEFTSQDVTRFLVLNTLNSQIPVLKHVLETPSANPLALYLTFVQLAGQLSTFAADIDPSQFPKFVHTDLRSTFEPLVDKIKELLGVTMLQRYVLVPLEPRKDGMWIGTLKDERLFKCKQFVMSVEADSPQQELSNRLPQLSKIASWKQINSIVRSATPGAPLKVTHRPPPEIPIRPRLVYFTVDASDRFWQQIVTEKTIAIYLPPPYDPSRAKLSLMGIPGGDA